MIYIVDIDGTICNTPKKGNSWDYTGSVPFEDRIKHFNDLFDQGHTINYWTARGTSSGINQYDLTKSQLDSWGVKYSSFSVGKPSYDFWIDDKAFNVDHYFEKINK